MMNGISFTEILVGIGVGLFVGSTIKAIRRGKKNKANSMYDGKGAKVPPMKNNKKKKKKK